MDADWMKSPMARRVVLHWADARPTWLWSRDGSRLIWRNDAARFFRGKIKKHGLKLAPEAVPIRGQVARLVRLGSVGRSSLSHIQFLSGDKPVSTTCACTPLRMPDGEIVLLIVAVDPIEPELLEADPHRSPDSVTLKLLPRNADFLLIDDDSRIAGGSARALELYAPAIESEGMPSLAQDDAGTVTLADQTVRVCRFSASPNEAVLLLFLPMQADSTATSPEPPERPGASDEHEPPLPLGLPEAERRVTRPALPGEDAWVEPLPEPAPSEGRLSSLFDRLADDDELYTPLTAADEAFTGPSVVPPATVFVPPAEPVTESPAAPVDADIDASPPSATVEAAPDLDAIGAIIVAAEAEPSSAAEAAAEAEPAPEAPEIPPAAPRRLWRVTGRGIRAAEQQTAPSPGASEPEPTVALTDAETVERVSRYNFDELSRILSDRVGRTSEERREPVAAPKAGDGALINLTGETFILNRLPLGILVFRDQQVLFANRALTEMTGHDSIESVRAAGLSAVFPAEAVSAGPVSQLVRRDGGLVTVNARLQSITWHGKPALMLSASLAEPRLGHEAAVRSYAALAADTAEDGFIGLDRSGVITEVSLLGRVLLGDNDEALVGRPVAALLDPSAIGELKLFLERPARFAETARPALRMALQQRSLELSLFAEGQAGIVAGYFGVIRRRAAAAVPASDIRSAHEVEPTVLARMSRGIRRPLNSIVGFADMIGGKDGANLPAERQAEYARDIRSAGQEIAALVDEMDDYARLQEGRYPAQADDVELGALLETCLLRVRSQAGAGRVLVRNAVSEHLPRIIADRASLTQAVLNLLASAIDQTPAGGSVILSAQSEDDGSVVVNLRDGGTTHRDFGERFMVFRDGPGRDGEIQAPVRSSVGLALTRSLLAVNALSLSVDPTSGTGTLFSLVIPADKVARGA